MDGHGFIMWIIIGAVAGWLASVLIKGSGLGLIGDILVGVAGAFIGGWLAGMLGIHIGSGLIASILTATVGAALLLAAIKLLVRR